MFKINKSLQLHYSYFTAIHWVGSGKVSREIWKKMTYTMSPKAANLKLQVTKLKTIGVKLHPL